MLLLLVKVWQEAFIYIQELDTTSDESIFLSESSPPIIDGKLLEAKGSIEPV
jgi:hypothetical protein